MSELPYYDGPSWDVAETEVLRYGVVRYREATQAAKESGVTPVYVLACVQYYGGMIGTYNPRDLLHRLLRSAPFLDPDDPATWPGGN